MNHFESTVRGIYFGIKLSWRGEPKAWWGRATKRGGPWYQGGELYVELCGSESLDVQVTGPSRPTSPESTACRFGILQGCKQGALRLMCIFEWKNSFPLSRTSESHVMYSQLQKLRIMGCHHLSFHFIPNSGPSFLLIHHPLTGAPRSSSSREAQSDREKSFSLTTMDLALHVRDTRHRMDRMDLASRVPVA